MPQPSSPAAVQTRALVIGAGPIGLFQVFQLGLLGIQADVVEALPHVGGQCLELYPDKPIYDIPGLPACTGRELIARLQQQITPFTPRLHLQQQVCSLQRRADGQFELSTDGGRRFVAQTVFIAAGVGAFLPQRLRVEGIEAFEGQQLSYHDSPSMDHAGQHLVIVGGTDTAIDSAIRHAQAGTAASVTLVHRRDGFQADPQGVPQMRQLCEQQHMRFRVGQLSGYQAEVGRLKQLELSLPDGSTQTLLADHLLVLQGISPKLGPVLDWGLALEKKQLMVDTASFSTSEPGIFAVGDINHYPGKKKLILCGFHEATLAAYAAAERIFPEQRVLLQYTTTSSLLQQRLGLKHSS
jgi:thioredoxin reductase (NADPH)